MTVVKSNSQTIVEFIVRQMDSEPVPPAGSKELMVLEDAVRQIQKHKSSGEYEHLGFLCLGAVIDKVSSNIQAQATLGKLIRGDYAG